jgi:hypothetical protein
MEAPHFYKTNVRGRKQTKTRFITIDGTLYFFRLFRNNGRIGCELAPYVLGKTIDDVVVLTRQFSIFDMSSIVDMFETYNNAAD